jgi:TIR domain
MMPRRTSRSMKNDVELFISYSHSNATWLGQLQPMVQFPDCHDKACAWDDQEMKAGDRWDREIKAALERMEVFVCLVSIEFLTSRYVRTVELSRAFEREENGEIEIAPILIYPNIDLGEECPELIEFNPLPK